MDAQNTVKKPESLHPITMHTGGGSGTGTIPMKMLTSNDNGRTRMRTIHVDEIVVQSLWSQSSLQKDGNGCLQRSLSSLVDITANQIHCSLWKVFCLTAHTAAISRLLSFMYPHSIDTVQPARIRALVLLSDGSLTRIFRTHNILGFTQMLQSDPLFVHVASNSSKSV